MPACTNRVFVELHHEGGWRSVGHSTANVLNLCSAHHVARHARLLFIEGDANETLTFRLADGTVVGGDRRLASRGANVTRASVPRGTSSRAPEGPVELTEAALRKLEFTPVEVRKRVAVALQRVGPQASVEELTLAALRASG